MADMSDLDDVHLGSSVILPVSVALLSVRVELLQGVGSEWLEEVEEETHLTRPSPCDWGRRWRE